MVEQMYDAEHAAFYDLQEPGSRKIRVRTPTLFFPLAIEELSEDIAARVVEAHFEDEARKNQLCGVVPSPERATEWLSMSLQSAINSFAWMQEPVLVQWLARSRLNSTRGLMWPKEKLTPEQNAARARIRAATPGAVANLSRLVTARNEVLATA